MRFGLSFASHPDCVDLAVRAESAGYDTVWLYDSPALGSDPYVTLVLAANATSTIDLGIGVAVPMLRLPHVLATTVGTLNHYAAGRLRIGLGTGFTGALSIGARPANWSLMAETTQLVRAWLRDEEATMTVDGIPRTVRHLHPGRGHLNTTDEVPLYVSATGPRGQKVAGSLGDGLWTISVDRRPDGAWLKTETAVPREIAHARGQGQYPVILLTAAAIRGGGEAPDSDRLRSFLGPWVTTYLHSVFPIRADLATATTGSTGVSSLSGPTGEDSLLSEARRAYAEKVIRSLPPDAPWLAQHTGHSIFVRPEEQEFVTADLIEHLSLVGTVDELVREIKDLEDAGLTELVWQVVPGHEDEIERFASEIIHHPDLRPAS
jgi:5,10-methylenetetrahydromethanopterin reductase